MIKSLKLSKYILLHRVRIVEFLQLNSHCLKQKSQNDVLFLQKNIVKIERLNMV